MTLNPIALFNKDLIQSFGGYLDKLSLLTSARACKTWHVHLEKQRLSTLEDSYCEQMGYLRWLITDLRSRNLSLFRLPLLTVNELKEIEKLEAFTFFDSHLYDPYPLEPTCDPIEMHLYERRINKFPSLMRFIDEDGLPGIAFKVRGTIEGRHKIKINNEGIPFRDLSILILFRPGVVSLYPRPEFSNKWGLFTKEYISAIYSYGHPQYVKNHFNKQTGETIFCPSCPSFSKDDERLWLISLIKGEDPMVKLDGEIEQIQTAIPVPSPSPYLQDSTPPLNETPSLLLQPNPPVEPVTSTSLLNNCSKALCAFFLSIYGLFCYLISLCRREPAA
jgi:hypothetical protein